MSIKCGNCKGRHESVSEVRACYGTPLGVTNTSATKCIHGKSTRGYCEDCVMYSDSFDQDQWDAKIAEQEANQAKYGFHSRDRAYAAASTNREVRTEATERLRRSHETSRVLTKPEVLAGRYALDSTDGKLRFYKVDKPTEGRWAGYTFVNQVVGGGYEGYETRYPVKNRAERERILAEIGQDIQGAMERYGKELGSCGHCGRQLTDEDSRARGIGPVCASKLGW